MPLFFNCKDKIRIMKNTAKKLLMTLLAIAISNVVFATNDTIKLKISPSKHPIRSNLITADQGEPNIRYVSKYIAIPKNADFDISFLVKGEKTTDNTYIEPAQKIASDYDSTDNQPIEDSLIYSKDEFFPVEIIKTERISTRDADLLLISVAAEQYNPVKKQTKTYNDIEICICVKDKTDGDFTIEKDNLTEMLKGIVENPDFFDNAETIDITGRRDGCNYLVVIPDEEYRTWADSLKNFREEQGIITKVITINDIGYNWHDTLKKRFKYICENWHPSPEAILLIGDYDFDHPRDGISTFVGFDHPEGSAYEPYFSDNMLVDFNGDDISDIVIARMPASNAAEAALMIAKTINYERHPSGDPSYYNSPITAMGYDKSRWFQLCTEIVAGYWDQHGKQCVRINAIHEGIPDSIWSTAQNTDLVLNQFGPEGSGYIPSTMSYLTDWSGDNTQITEAVETGSFMMVHRDHGTYETWGEPYFSTSYINALNNEDLTFVLSANCQTGHFGYGGGYSDCFAERFLKTSNGAVAAIAASELSYSFVNDIYVWGLFDYLYPDFMPDYGSQNIDFQYPAFANLYGKLFLKKSSFPNNSSYISITNRLFHYFGDAYLQLNSEFPENISINHPASILPGQSHITIEAEDNSCIALSIDSQLIAKGKPENGKVTLHFMPQYEGTKIKVVATKQNHFRHESFVTVTNNIGIDENHETSFNIFPNPSKGKFTINGIKIDNIKIYNILGVEVKNIESSNSDKLEIDISDLNDGIYLVLVNNQISRKIQKTE